MGLCGRRLITLPGGLGNKGIFAVRYGLGGWDPKRPGHYFSLSGYVLGSSRERTGLVYLIMVYPHVCFIGSHFSSIDLIVFIPCFSLSDPETGFYCFAKLCCFSFLYCFSQPPTPYEHEKWVICSPANVAQNQISKYHSDSNSKHRYNEKQACVTPSPSTTLFR